VADAGDAPQNKTAALPQAAPEDPSAPSASDRALADRSAQYYAGLTTGPTAWSFVFGSLSLRRGFVVRRRLERRGLPMAIRVGRAVWIRCSG